MSRGAIFAADVRRLGGVVTITAGRDRISSEPFYVVHHVSRGGDVVFQSRPLPEEDSAFQAAQVLAEFTGAIVRR